MIPNFTHDSLTQSRLDGIGLSDTGGTGVAPIETRQRFDGRCNSIFYRYPLDPITPELLWARVLDSHGQLISERKVDDATGSACGFLPGGHIVKVYRFDVDSALKSQGTKESAGIYLLFLDEAFYRDEARRIRERK